MHPPKKKNKTNAIIIFRYVAGGKAERRQPVTACTVGSRRVTHLVIFVPVHAITLLRETTVFRLHGLRSLGGTYSNFYHAITLLRETTVFRLHGLRSLGWTYPDFYHAVALLQ